MMRADAASRARAGPSCAGGCPSCWGGSGCRLRRRVVLVRRVLSAGPPGLGRASWPASRPTAGGTPAWSWRWSPMSSISTPGPRGPRWRPRLPSGGPRSCARRRRAAARADAQAVGSLGDVAAEAVDLGDEGGEPVGLVPPDVADAADPRARSARAASATTVGASSPTFQVERDAPDLRPPVTVRVPSVQVTVAPMAARSCARGRPPGWSRTAIRDPHGAAGGQGRRQERAGVGEVLFDPRGRRPGSCPGARSSGPGGSRPP